MLYARALPKQRCPRVHKEMLFRLLSVFHRIQSLGVQSLLLLEGFVYRFLAGWSFVFEDGWRWWIIPVHQKVPGCGFLIPLLGSCSSQHRYVMEMVKVPKANPMWRPFPTNPEANYQALEYWWAPFQQSVDSRKSGHPKKYCCLKDKRKGGTTMCEPERLLFIPPITSTPMDVYPPPSKIFLLSYPIWHLVVLSTRTIRAQNIRRNPHFWTVVQSLGDGRVIVHFFHHIHKTTGFRQKGFQCLKWVEHLFIIGEV